MSHSKGIRRGRVTDGRHIAGPFDIRCLKVKMCRCEDLKKIFSVEVHGCESRGMMVSCMR